MIVDFMLIGAQKAGSTSLSHQLSQHPQISFCKHKEPDFFSTTRDWESGLTDYHALFEQRPERLYGEGSTTYTWIPEYPQTAWKIHAYNPNVKLMYMMRQPVERVISHYTHHLLRARTLFPGEREVFEVPTYINHSRYGMQLRPYLELFPKQNTLLLIFEEYILQPMQTLYRVADFLGIDRHGFDGVDLSPQYQSLERTGDTQIKKWLTPFSRIFPVRVRNALRGPFVYKLMSRIEFSEPTKRLLWRFLEDDVRAVEEMMGRSIDLWRRSPYG